MSPALEQQQATSPGGCDTAGKGVFSNIVDETAAYLQKDDGQDLAAQIAGLALDDHEAKSVLSHDSTTEEEPAPKGMDENSNPKLAASTAAPVSVIPHTEGTIHLHQKAAEDADRLSDEESAGCELEQDNKSDNPTLPTPVNLPNGGSFTIDMSAVAKNTSSEPKQADESDTPRLKTYMKLHNDMMTSKSALTSHATEQAANYHHASHVARTLLISNDRHGDLPLVMHAHACLVLGCSDENDCYERMQEALVLVKYAMSEGALSAPEGEALLETCELVMGMREDEAAGSEDEASDGSEGEEDGEGEGVGEKDDGELEKNDALPWIEIIVSMICGQVVRSV